MLIYISFYPKHSMNVQLKVSLDGSVIVDMYNSIDENNEYLELYYRIL